MIRFFYSVFDSNGTIVVDNQMTYENSYRELKNTLEEFYPNCSYNIN